MPTEEQFDKEKAKAEVHAMENVPNSDKPPAPTPALSPLPGVPQHTGAEKQKYDGEIEKLYKEMDDKVNFRGRVTTTSRQENSLTRFRDTC